MMFSVEHPLQSDCGAMFVGVCLDASVSPLNGVESCCRRSAFSPSSSQLVLKLWRRNHAGCFILFVSPLCDLKPFLQRSDTHTLTKSRRSQEQTVRKPPAVWSWTEVYFSFQKALFLEFFFFPSCRETEDKQAGSHVYMSPHSLTRAEKPH